MAPSIIQVNYEQLDAIATRFDTEVEHIAQLEQTIRRRVETLRQGGWEGAAAVAFYREVDSEITPTVRRLIEALRTAQETVLRIKATFQAAEKEAEALFTIRAVPRSLHSPLRQELPDSSQYGLVDPFEQLKNFELPFWLQVALTVVPFVDLIDIISELVKGAMGQDVDELVLTLAVLGIIADAGWLSPEPATEALNGLIGFGKVLLKNVPPGPARDAIANLIEQAARNIGDDPGEVKRLWDVARRLMGDQKLFDELMANPEALEYVLRQSPEFLDRLSVHNLSPTDATRLVGHLSQMQRLPIPPNLPTPANLHGLADEVDMRHFLEGHTWDYLNPATRGRAPVTTLWPQGTTPEDVSNYLQEALDRLNRDGTVVHSGSPVQVPLANGTIVQVGVRFDPVTNKTVIGQFYPVSGAGMIQIPKSEMRIIGDMLNP